MNYEEMYEQEKAYSTDLEDYIKKLEKKLEDWKQCDYALKAVVIAHQEVIAKLEKEIEQRDQQWCPTSIACSAERDELRDIIIDQAEQIKAYQEALESISKCAEESPHVFESSYAKTNMLGIARTILEKYK